MRIVGTMMGLKHMSSEVGFMKRELMHKILEAYMFRVDQSHERRQDKSSKLWRAHLRVFLGQEETNSNWSLKGLTQLTCLEMVNSPSKI
ncbi:hypothetical protein CRG98_021647 [Punica granatum]|uniref:Uncharacterized protein n=1 Tax=Punica granatum TaxID=22663 RepID=A0A2I0JP00_PUNGR|nr:hypothetical protein CRG98_021647 [Punica granatum]